MSYNYNELVDFIAALLWTVVYCLQMNESHTNRQSTRKWQQRNVMFTCCMCKIIKWNQVSYAEIVRMFEGQRAVHTSYIFLLPLCFMHIQRRCQKGAGDPPTSSVPMPSMFFEKCLRILSPKFSWYPRIFRWFELRRTLFLVIKSYPSPKFRHFSTLCALVNITVLCDSYHWFR